MVLGQVRGAVVAQGHQPAILPNPRSSRFQQLKLVPLASPTQARLSPAAVTAMCAPSRSPIPSPKPRCVSSTTRPSVAKTLVLSEAASSGDTASTPPASSNVVPPVGNGRTSRDRGRRTARARQTRQKRGLAGALFVERHLIVFLSAWRSAAERQAPNLTLDFPVPSSQKR